MGEPSRVRRGERPVSFVFEEMLRVREPRKAYFRWTILGCSALTVGGGVAGCLGDISAFAVATLIVACAIASIILAIAATQRLVARETRVRVDREGLHLWPPSKTIARSDIGSGFFRPASGLRRNAGSILLEGPRGRELLELEVAGAAQGAALLRALGLDASGRRVSWRVGGSVASRLAGGGPLRFTVFALLALWELGHFVKLPGILWPLTLGAVVVVSAWSGRVEIAADGIHATWLLRGRLIAFSELERIETTRAGTNLRLRSKKRIAIPRIRGEWRGEAMLARMREAFAAYERARKGASRGRLEGLLARGNRSHAAWRNDLLALRGDGYRALPIGDEELWQVLEDPSAAADVRQGAALLLREGLDEDGRARVQEIAESSAFPALRVALYEALAQPEIGAAEDQREGSISSRRLPNGS